MVVTIDNPRGASYGGTVSGPTFKRSCQRILKYWNIPPDPEDDEAEHGGAEKHSRKKSGTV
jgi:hypothetical protein